MPGMAMGLKFRTVVGSFPSTNRAEVDPLMGVHQQSQMTDTGKRGTHRNGRAKGDKAPAPFPLVRHGSMRPQS